MNFEMRKDQDQPLLSVDKDVYESAMQTTGLFRFQKKKKGSKMSCLVKSI